MNKLIIKLQYSENKIVLCNWKEKTYWKELRKERCM